MIRFIIPGEFPDLNTVIAAAKCHFGKYSSMKKKYTDLVIFYSKDIPVIEKPVEVTFCWYTKNLRKDPDGVSVGGKFILDGLKEGGKIQNDTRKWITGINHKFPKPDKKNPRVEIYIREVEPCG